MNIYLINYYLNKKVLEIRNIKTDDLGIKRV